MDAASDSAIRREDPPVVLFMLRALASRNYRLFFAGQIVSLIGTWLTTVATSWLVYRLSTASMPEQAALILGAVGFCGQIPVFLLSPFAGVWVDRWNRQRILICTQASFLVVSFLLAGLTFNGTITIAAILVLNLLHGIIQAVDIPTRQAFVFDLVDDRRDLSNAIALNSSMVQGTRLLGPAVAGVLIYAFGEGLCFLIDGFSYLAVLMALLAMRFLPRSAAIEHSHPLRAFVDGLRYASGSRPIRTLLAMVALVSLMTMSQSTLMPLFANQIFGGGERTLGILLATAGGGALAGSLYLAARRTVLGLGRVIAGGACCLGLSLILFGLSQNLFVALFCILIAGGATVISMASCNTVLQTIVDEDKRGRVMSLFATAFIGMAPFGSLLAGTLATEIGPQPAVIASGIICVLSGILFSLRIPALRKLILPIYAQRGVLPQIAAGIQSSEAEP